MATDDMDPTLPEKPLLQRGYSRKHRRSSDVQADLRLDDLAAREAQLRERQRLANERAVLAKVAPVFKAAIALYPGGQEAYASVLGIARPSLVAMCNGERLIGPRDWLPLAGEPAAWALWIGGLARLGVVAMRVVRAPVVTASEVKERIVREVLRDATLREIIMPRVERELGIAPGEAELALEVGDEEHDEGAPLQQAPVTP